MPSPDTQKQAPAATATIEIFKAGTHTDAAGITRTYTPEMLAKAAEAYTPELAEAPLVIGHPKTDAPAYGWVKKLRAEGGRLLAEVAQVAPAFSAAWQQGRYKKLSASFYLPEANSNPAPGSLYLRHIGALGAAAPAVAGLAPANFSADAAADGIVSFEQTAPGRSLAARLRSWIQQRWGDEDADAVLTADELAQLEAVVPDASAEAVAAAADAQPEAPAEAPAADAGADKGDAASTSDDAADAQPTGQDEGESAGDAASTSDDAPATEADAEAKDEDEAETTDNAAPAADPVALKLAELAEREAAIAAREAELRAAETAAFCAQMVEAGRIRPADKERAETLLASLYTTDATVCFNATETSAADAFKAFVSNLPPIVEFAAVAVPEETPAPAVAEFVAPEGYEVDEEAVMAYRRIAQLAARKGISFTEAAAQVK